MPATASDAEAFLALVFAGVLGEGRAACFDAVLAVFGPLALIFSGVLDLSQLYNVFGDTSSSLAIVRLLIFLLRYSSILAAWASSLRLFAGPSGRPRCAPAAFFFCSASLVRTLMKCRSIWAARPNSVAMTVACIEPSRMKPSFTTCKWIFLTVQTSMISKTWSSERASLETSDATITSPSLAWSMMFPMLRCFQSLLPEAVSSTNIGAWSPLAAQYAATPCRWLSTSCWSVETRR